jgi:hypothetical protein
MTRSLLLVDTAIGRHDAESLVSASKETVLTLLITTDTPQGRLDVAAAITQMADMGTFDNIGIASNGPEIPLVFIEQIDALFVLLREPARESESEEMQALTDIHFFGSYTRSNNAFVSIFQMKLAGRANVYVSTDRTGNPSQNGNWLLHGVKGQPAPVVDISTIYFETDSLTKIAATFEAPYTRRHSHHGYRHGHGHGHRHGYEHHVTSDCD